MACYISSIFVFCLACLRLGVSCTVCVRRGGCACLVLPHGSHTGTLGLPDGFWLPERFGFPSAYSSPIHVVFLDRVFHSGRVGITWNSRAAGVAPPNLGNSYVIISCSIYHTHHILHMNFHCIPFPVSSITRSYKASTPTSSAAIPLRLPVLTLAFLQIPRSHHSTTSTQNCLQHEHGIRRQLQHQPIPRLHHHALNTCPVGTFIRVRYRAAYLSHY